MLTFYLRAAAAAGALLPSLAAAQSMSGMSGMDHSKMHVPAKPKPRLRPKSAPKAATIPSTAAQRSTPKDAVPLSTSPSNEPASLPPDAVAGMATKDPATTAMPMDHGAADHGTADHAAMDPGAVEHGSMDHGTMDHQSIDHASQPDHHGRGQHDREQAGLNQMQDADHEMAGMAGMESMDHMTMGRGGTSYATGSGTSRLPASEGAMHGVHFTSGDWAFMVHGYAWGAYTDQGGPRGDNEVFVTSMLMLNATHDLSSRAHVTLRSMLSLEPLMGPRGYPNLFATGETADGINQLLDRQHPHDLFMELSARIDLDLGSGSAFLYAAPVGEPALGPSAFMHRGSARYQTLSPITHHWFDSTHISYGVITAGYAAPKWQLEASAYRGREPDQHRWDIEAPAIDSWSVRATWTPSPAWAVQVSHGHLKSPEQLEPNDNENRTTASVQFAHRGLATTFAFSAKDKGPGRTLTAWLAEANWDISRHHTIFGRAENVANDELFPDTADPLNGQRFRVTKIEGGYTYRLPFAGPFNLALGGSVAGYAYPATIDGAYGTAPISYTLFAKLSLGH